MDREVSIQAIARIRNDFTDKFGIPRQSGLAEELESLIIFEEPFRDAQALRGIEGYSHLWLIWHFSANADAGWHPTVRPPRLGGNARLGVFATRSPFRPNGLGLSSVRLLGVESRPGLGTVLRVGGADLMDGTPIFDIKPYIPYTDSHPTASGGFTQEVEYRLLEVSCPPELLEQVEPSKREGLIKVLRNDPRPHYHRDPEREYRMSFGALTVAFTVDGERLTVRNIRRG